MTHYDRYKKQEESTRLATEYMVEMASKKSLRKGQRQGIIKGKRQGIIEGERKQAFHTVRELLKEDSLSLERISAIASISIKEVKEIREQMQEASHLYEWNPIIIKGNSSISDTGKGSFYLKKRRLQISITLH